MDSPRPHLPWLVCPDCEVFLGAQKFRAKGRKIAESCFRRYTRRHGSARTAHRDRSVVRRPPFPSGPMGRISGAWPEARQRGPAKQQMQCPPTQAREPRWEGTRAESRRHAAKGSALVNQGGVVRASRRGSPPNQLPPNALRLTGGVTAGPIPTRRPLLKAR